MNDEVKFYYFFDLGIMVLVGKKVIVYVFVINLLGCKNEYGCIDGEVVCILSDYFFYLGVYIILGKKVVYDVFNF